MLRHLVTIDDLSESEILAIFALADEYLARMGSADKPWRVGGRMTDADQFVLATLFYEASTRTRFSFESAMIRLGGHVLSSADPKTTSAAKGETLADTIRVVQNYADVVVIRHPSEGAVRVASDFADIPVINAGDGGHEHPTQTLCDLYTLQREKGSLRGLNVALWGDLKHGRTVHSLVYGLARFGARIIPLPGEGLGLPEHVIRRLLHDYDCVPHTGAEIAHGRRGDLPVDVMYVTPHKPHQRTLYTRGDDGLSPETMKSLATIDALYVTRLQRERTAGDPAGIYSVVDAEFLNTRLDQHSSVLHPLPRVEELGYDLDNDSRAVYFKQASYGVPVRMALMAALLDLQPGLLASYAPQKPYVVYRRPNLDCHNPTCITRHEAERRYLRQKFWIVPDSNCLLLRCAYCEHELIPPYVGRVSTGVYQRNSSRWDVVPDDVIVFTEEAAAHAEGYRLLAESIAV